jgi:hypothetical protein
VKKRREKWRGFGLEERGRTRYNRERGRRNRGGEKERKEERKSSGCRVERKERRKRPCGPKGRIRKEEK